MNRKIYIAPSLLAADFSNLEKVVRQCEQANVDMLHLDIMDGHFVPNITFGPFIIAALRKLTKLPFSTHLMISNPDQYIQQFAESGSDYISVHVEGAIHLHRTLMLIKSFGKKAGVVLNPLTPLCFAYEAAEFADYILLMTVNPGFGGQEFINSFYRRCEQLKEYLIKSSYDNVLIEVDGGVSSLNAGAIVRAGADILVAGSALFKGDFKTNVDEMRNAINKIDDAK